MAKFRVRTNMTVMRTYMVEAGSEEEAMSMASEGAGENVVEDEDDYQEGAERVVFCQMVTEG